MATVRVVSTTKKVTTTKLATVKTTASALTKALTTVKKVSSSSSSSVRKPSSSSSSSSKAKAVSSTSSVHTSTITPSAAAPASNNGASTTKSGMSTGLVVGLIAGVLLIAGIAICSFILYRRAKEKQSNASGLMRHSILGSNDSWAPTNKDESFGNAASGGMRELDHDHSPGDHGQNPFLNAVQYDQHGAPYSPAPSLDDLRFGPNSPLAPSFSGLRTDTPLSMRDSDLIKPPQSARAVPLASASGQAVALGPILERSPSLSEFHRVEMQHQNSAPSPSIRYEPASPAESFGDQPSAISPSSPPQRIFYDSNDAPAATAMLGPYPASPPRPRARGGAPPAPAPVMMGTAVSNWTANVPYGGGRVAHPVAISYPIQQANRMSHAASVHMRQNSNVPSVIMPPSPRKKDTFAQQESISASPPKLRQWGPPSSPPRIPTPRAPNSTPEPAGDYFAQPPERERKEPKKSGLSRQRTRIAYADASDDEDGGDGGDPDHFFDATAAPAMPKTSTPPAQQQQPGGSYFDIWDTMLGPDDLPPPNPAYHTGAEFPDSARTSAETTRDLQAVAPIARTKPVLPPIDTSATMTLGIHDASNALSASVYSN